MTIAGAGSMPPVTPVERAHSDRVRTRIAERIAEAGGWISFADFMQSALYEPGLGYYSAGAVKFGAAGDFVTAPEISPFFAQACARVFDRILNRLGSGELLELGPGSGRFAAVAMAEMHAQQTPITAYKFLEISADLRAQQRLLLVDTPYRTEWLDDIPREFTGVMFGNEVIDAMPCERFVIRDGEFWRLGVGCDTNSLQTPAFEWRVRPADGACADDESFTARATALGEWLRSEGELTGEQSLPEGYCGEWHPHLSAWVSTMANSLDRGALILADYGLPRQQLYHPDRMTGSLRCHHRHHAHADPFLWPGLTDITAWVDFTAVAEAGLAAGLQLAQFTTQTAFLLESGLAATPANSRESQGLRQLLMPGEMGESVKFMVLTREPAWLETPGVQSISLQDLRDSLRLQYP